MLAWWRNHLQMLSAMYRSRIKNHSSSTRSHRTPLISNWTRKCAQLQRLRTTRVAKAESGPSIQSWGNQVSQPRTPLCKTKTKPIAKSNLLKCSNHKTTLQTSIKSNNNLRPNSNKVAPRKSRKCWAGRSMALIGHRTVQIRTMPIQLLSSPSAFLIPRVHTASPSFQIIRNRTPPSRRQWGSNPKPIWKPRSC